MAASTWNHISHTSRRQYRPTKPSPFAKRPQPVPEYDDHREDRAELDDDVEHFQKGVRRLHPQEFPREDQVPGAGDGQPFGDALEDAQQHGKQIIQHNASSDRLHPFSRRVCAFYRAKTSPTGQWSEP
jgi:hypothetical protein